MTLDRITDGIFRLKAVLLGLFALLTAFFAYQATQLEIDAGFAKHLPKSHPYIQTYIEHRDLFGGANRLLIAVEAKDGDIFTPDFMATLKEVTDAVFFLPGVDRSTVRSIFTPNVRFMEIVEGGFAGGNVVPAEFANTPEDIAQVQVNILKSNEVGRLVANDFTAAMVEAELVEIDPRTGERLDYLAVAQQLENDIRAAFSNERTEVHIVGFAQLVGDIASAIGEVVIFFAIAFVITAILVRIFTHSARLTLVPLVCSVVAVIWTLGLLVTLGYGIDPMSILAPFLVFAIGVSHGVQMINAVGARVEQGETCRAATREALRRLLVPGGIALASDCIGFLTILLIDIEMIQELAITASIGVGVVIITNMIAVPLLLSGVDLGEKYVKRARAGKAMRDKLWDRVAKLATPKAAAVSLGLAVVLYGVGTVEGSKLPIGDLHEGVPTLRPDSRFNQDVAFISEHFSISLDYLTVVAETKPDACVDYQVMRNIDDLAWALANLEGTQSTLSLPQVAKVINAGWGEGHPAWRILPRDPQALSLAIRSVDTSTGLLNGNCSVMPVVAFLEDHRAATLERVVAAVETYQAANPDPETTFLLASGPAGVMAAANQIVEQNQVKMLIYIYAAVITLCLVTFRSISATVCIILPLTLVSVMAYAVMTWLQIGLKVETLPVAALGVGIGVDYGIYIMNRLKTLLDEGRDLDDAYRETLEVSGNAVLVTGLCLAIGVSTWAFSQLQFQADMGILLTFMFLANMIGAIALLPAGMLVFRKLFRGRAAH